MSEPEVLLEHKGTVDFKTIDQLLERLRFLPACRALDRSVQKRIYSIFVECLENIYRHTNNDLPYRNDKKLETYIFLSKHDKKCMIGSGNIVSNNNINKLKNKLKQINQLDKKGLKGLYTDIIDKEFFSDEDGAGLGLIIIALNAENEIDHNFITLDDEYSFFEMKIFV